MRPSTLRPPSPAPVYIYTSWLLYVVAVAPDFFPPFFFAEWIDRYIHNIYGATIFQEERWPQSCSVVGIEWPLDQRFSVRQGKRRTDVCLSAAMSDVFYQWAREGGVIVLPKKGKKKRRHFVFIWFVSYSYSALGKRREIESDSFFVWRFHRLQQTHINPSLSNPPSISLFVTYTHNAAACVCVCVCTL